MTPCCLADATYENPSHARERGRLARTCSSEGATQAPSPQKVRPQPFHTARRPISPCAAHTLRLAIINPVTETRIRHTGVPSPCISICCLRDDLCIGCGRTLDEIRQWGRADDETRTAILHEAEMRLQQRRAQPPADEYRWMRNGNSPRPNR